MHPSRPPATRSAAHALAVLGMIAGIALIGALSIGSGAAGPADAWHALVGAGASPEAEVILRLRLPRALGALATGACLGVAGALMQVLLRNPLADPYVLGTSGGAAVGALLVLMAGGAGWLLTGAAFAGALMSTLLVFALAGSGTGFAARNLLLTGIVVAAGLSAAISLLLAVSPEASLRGILFWLMGDFSFVENPYPALVVAVVGTVVAYLLARTLNVMRLGDRQAMLLGVDAIRVRYVIYGLCALLTGVAVTTAGVVGFVGLVVPHLVRLAAGSDHRIVVPGAALGGGALLVVADTLARVLLAPRQLPVGAITAAVGVPLFLYLLQRERASLRTGA